MGNLKGKSVIITGASAGFLSPENVGQVLVTICSQTDNCYVAELRLASKNVKFL